jgi:hypothetical protein
VAAFVTGIAPTQDVGKLESMLGGISGIDREKFVVITSEEATEEHEESFIDFVHVNPEDDMYEGNLPADTHIFEGDDSSNVPGITRSEPSMQGYLSHPHFVRHVGNLPIPDDEAENYNDAIDAGRSIVAYPADGNSAQIEAAFRSAGLAHVKTF